MVIHSLRPEFRPDNARNQVRASQSLARRLYLAGLGGGALWIAYLFIGPLVFLDADGLVVQDREIVATPFDGQVIYFAARPGEKVIAGQQLGNVVSTQMLDLISGLVTRKAQVEARQSQIAARLSAITTTMPAAENRARAARAAQATIEKAYAGGFSTRVREAETTRDTYDAAREVESLRSERSSLQSENAAAKLNLSHLADALERARASYRDGVIMSPADGTIGARVAEPGAILSHNEVLAEVYRGRKYVLAYLPINRMFAISPGQKVIVTDGVNREIGRVERIDSITDRAPPEFQSSLHGVERNQVAHIVFDESTQFPLQAKIKLTGPYGPASLVDGVRWALAGRGEARVAVEGSPRLQAVAAAPVE
jgi:multidrug resistance efflux pump